MCDPTTLMAASFAISAVSAGVQYRQGNRAAKQQAEDIRKSAELQNIQTAQVYEQQNQASMEETSQRHVQWLQELGRLRTVGAESGLMGATEQRLENEASAAAERDIATIEANRLKGTQQTASTGVAQSRQATADLNSIRRPSLIGTGLQIAGAAVGAARAYSQAEKGRVTPTQAPAAKGAQR